ncbi:tRNA (guanine-N(1)-)-methyltransferase [Candidatus Profftia lariciata]|uniref:tRNA (guanosine(37)-N1)-methyltransferase TrmD n=1 Tax=Candidatus Profftia lariciata TaxID=1987921 RepID=UPI001D00E53D|nr:tRNA (guanosine(37)-N1)-methyltransferase TrmD [Candidatus Profftia lariciata]UDG81285.1 tRNA (guanine-N(1)-)-methyltransferase [Candidatus Profftia lariciata]
MWIGIISLFPKMFCALTEYGVTSRAIKNQLLQVQYWSPRDFACDRYRTVDDRPYGGGPGMLMMVEPLRKAIHAAKEVAGKSTKVIYLSPQGYKLTQQYLYQLIKNEVFILVCGRYEGIDERVICTEINEELSIGDFILSGGEIPAMVLIDAVSRFIPGVLNDSSSLEEESFAHGLLDYPHFTRPAVLEDMAVPQVLLSGHHENIRRWRLKQSLGRTWIKRPDLLKKITLNEEQEKLLDQFQKEYYFK